MKINNILLKLLLKKKLYLNNIQFKLVIKSFYKNTENILLNDLSNINKLLLYKIVSILSKSMFVYKTMLYTIILNSNNNKSVLTIFDSILNFNTSSNTIKDMNKPIITICNNINIIYGYIKNIHILVSSIYALKLYINNTCNSSKLPNKSEKITVLRSPHIDKKTREQFSITTHKSILYGLNLLKKDILPRIINKSNNEYIEYYT